MDSDQKGCPQENNSTYAETFHNRVQRRGISLTLAELLVILIFVCFISFGSGYGLSRYHSTIFHAPAITKLQAKDTLILEDFAKLETRVGLLEGKGKKKGWRTGP